MIAFTHILTFLYKFSSKKNIKYLRTIYSDLKHNVLFIVLGFSPSKEPESRQLIGLVIGMLSAVILLLMAAIAFIVIRNRKLKAAAAHAGLSGPFGQEKSVTINMKVNHLLTHEIESFFYSFFYINTIHIQILSLKI